MSELISKNTIALLKKARQTSIQKALELQQGHDYVGKNMWERRRIYLDDQLTKYKSRRNGIVPDRAVFVSYSKKSGGKYFRHIRKRLLQRNSKYLLVFTR